LLHGHNLSRIGLSEDFAQLLFTSSRAALPASNQELASHIGTVRELVSRNLSRLKAEGMLQIDGQTVTISNLKALEAEIDSPE
jgi:CRP-like cAMP-binding protein